jgi:glycosyltransferase involved in cell wall biosynthesis
MKLSVCVITYNHATFLRQALDSVLLQQANFDFEILIGEDDSNDGTRAIVEEYAARHPDRIRAFYRNRKENLIINGRATGRRNFVQTLAEARGQYIALLEGDDYWTDATKLQKQVDCLDAHPDCAICFHDVKVLNQVTGEEAETTQEGRPERYGLIDLLTSPCLMYMGAVVLRRRESLHLPKWFFKSPTGDLPFYCFHLDDERDGIAFIPRVMGCYRIHPGGVWSQGFLGSSQTGAARASTIRRHIAGIEGRELLNAHFRYRYDRAIGRLISPWAWSLVWLYQTEKDWRKMRKYWWKAIRARPVGGAKLSFIVKSFIAAHLPKVHLALWGDKR